MGIVFALFYPFIIVAYALLVGAFIASLIVFINNLRTGGKNKWPVKNRIGAIISAVLFIAVIAATIALTVYAVDFFSSSPSSNSSSSVRNAATALMAMNI